MMLSDLLNHVSRIWTPPAKIHGRLTMVIPSLADTRDGRLADKVHRQCQACAVLLATPLSMGEAISRAKHGEAVEQGNHVIHWDEHRGLPELPDGALHLEDGRWQGVVVG